MPIYEYQCKTCGKRFEFLQSITQPPLQTCPVDVCDQPVKGQGQVQRLLSRNVGFIFTGSGFYITDYVRKNSATEKTQTSPESSSSQDSST